MRKSAFALLLAGVAVRAEDKPVIPDAVKANINARIAAGETAGIVVGFVGAGGETYMSAGVLETGKPGKVDPDTIFEIGSITKAFTGILLADMAKQGLVKLDDPVRKYLPDTVQVPKDKREITLLDLATHHSSLPRMPGNFSPADPDGSVRGLHRREALRGGSPRPRSTSTSGRPTGTEPGHRAPGPRASRAAKTELRRPRAAAHRHPSRDESDLGPGGPGRKGTRRAGVTKNLKGSSSP